MSSCFDGACPGPPTISDVRTRSASGAAATHPCLGLRLGAPVLGARRRDVGLDVRSALAAVEDDVGREVDEPRADRRGRAGDVLGAVDHDLAGTLPVLAVGGVDHDVGPEPPEQLGTASRVADLDPLPGRAGREPEQLRAEEPGRAGDVDPHGSGARRLARRCLDPLDEERHRERDREPDQHALPRLLLELLAADVAEHRRVGRPEPAGDEVVAEEAVPRQALV